jgi:hypothetical protein
VLRHAVVCLPGYRIKLWKLSFSYAQTFRSSKP